MFSRRALSSLNSTERQLLRQQYVRSGQCVRCFNASLRKHAEGERSSNGPEQPQDREQSSSAGNDQGTPYNKPNRGPSRHQRSALISEEVRLLNRDTPNLGPSKPPNDGADFTAPPAATRPEDAPPGRMGENMPPEREGPLNQGAESRGLGGAGEDEVGTQKGNMNVRPDSAVGANLEPDVLDAGSTGVPVSEVAEKRVQNPKTRKGKGTAGVPVSQTPVSATPSGSRLPLPGVPVAPVDLTRKALMVAGHGASTIAGGNFEGALNDRLKIIAEPGSDEVHRDVHHLARKLLNRQLVFFRSVEEKESVLTECNRITGRGASMTDQERAAKGPDTERPYFEPIPEGVRKNLVSNMVNGQYDPEGLLKGAEKHKQSALNEIERTLMRNGTYLKGDSSRVLQKVRSLLPRFQAQQKARGGVAQQKGQR